MQAAGPPPARQRHLHRAERLRTCNRISPHAELEASGACKLTNKTSFVHGPFRTEFWVLCNPPLSRRPGKGNLDGEVDEDEFWLSILTTMFMRSHGKDAQLRRQLEQPVCSGPATGVAIRACGTDDPPTGSSTAKQRKNKAFDTRGWQRHLHHPQRSA